MALNIEIDFNSMTWGELRRFVTFGADKPDDELVETFASPYDDNETWGLRISDAHLPGEGDRS